MQELPFRQVDVFTSVPLFGNPVAVVFDADELSPEEMQRIARWTNLSETTFVVRSTVADYRLRIFTPRREMPFAGHPTIGSAHAVREEGRLGTRDEAVQECGAGLIPLRFADGGVRARAPRPKVRPAAIDRGVLRDALGGADVDDALAIDVGPVWIVARAPTLAALDGVTIASEIMARFTDRTDTTGVTVYAIDDGAVHVRSFAPADGIPEDPVCGSGNVSVAAHIRETGLEGRTGERYVARQGKHCGRDGRVMITIDGADVHLGGVSVTTIRGVLLSGMRLP
jgi:PhzF family phenazine biosynthesis protein